MNLSKLYIIFLMVGCLIALSGCTSYEKFSVKTTPNAKIFLPGENTPVSIADNTGKAKLSVPSNIYSSYITLQNNEYPFLIPMGLDIKKSDHGIWWKCFGGYMAMVASVPIALCGGDAGLFATLGIVGLGFMEEMTVGLNTFLQTDKIAYSMRFTYVNKQVLNLPKLSTTLINADPAKMILEESVTNRRKQAKSGLDVTDDEGYSTSKRSRRGVAKKISGVYKGSGQLFIEKAVDESYDDIVIKISEVDQNHVNVVILESGEEFFDKPILFEVKSNKNNYFLTNAKIPSIKVTITKKGTVSFLHPKVNIDGNIYTLTCTAEK